MSDVITYDLPKEISNEILQKLQEDSAVMQLAKQVKLPGAGIEIPVVLGDPEAQWVAENGKRTVSNAKVDKKIMSSYTLSVIEIISNKMIRDLPAVYDTLKERLPRSLAYKFDKTVLGGADKPGENFDTLANVTAQVIGTDTYQGLVAADGDIGENGGHTNGYVFAPQGKTALLSAVDNNGRPLFINNVSEGAVPVVLGAKTLLSKGAYISGSPEVVGFAGDWSMAAYGTVEGIKISFSDQATVDGINLWQQNMTAIKAEVELGFVCLPEVFNRLTK